MYDKELTEEELSQAIGGKTAPGTSPKISLVSEENEAGQQTPLGLFSSKADFFGVIDDDYPGIAIAGG